MTPTCYWITGRPGSGKSSLLAELKRQRPEWPIFDGEHVRAALYADLGYSAEERWQQIRTLTMLANTAVMSGSSVAVACVSPLRDHRAYARHRIMGRFVEVGLYGREREMWEGTSYERPRGQDAILANTKVLRPTDIARQLLEPRVPRQLFIGRWQPFHPGHEKIVRDALAAGPVAIGVRETEIDGDNPYSAQERVATIRHEFEGEDVEVFVCPDISSIHIGRDVGYDIVEHDAVGGYSGSAIRASRSVGA